MKKVWQRPTPLIELPREQDPAQVALLIRSARTAPDEHTPRVVWRIRDTLYRRTERRARALRFAVVGLVIFVMGGAVGAVVHPFLRLRPSAEPPAPTPSREHGARRRPARASAPPQAPTPPQVQVEPPPVETPKIEAAPATPPALPAPVTRSKPKPAPMRLAALQPAMVETVPPSPPPVSNAPAPAPAPHTPQAAEQALISGALGKLRVSHEPGSALALLDEHRTRFPNGVLASEAARLRREALLRLGRKALVLDELDRTLSSDATAGDERVLRGELRAAAGRWQAALADFDAVVRAYPHSGPEVNDRRVRDRLERALWGRATAHSHLGNDNAVCADLGESLRRFPHGRFAVQAKELFDKECEP